MQIPTDSSRQPTVPVCLGVGLLLPLLLLGQSDGDGDAFKKSGSDKDYIHRLVLRDSFGRPIDPAAEDAIPWSMVETCGPCHDVEAIASGLHFGDGPDGRRGEPWVLLDGRSGTQAPISSRQWAGSWKPEDFGLASTEYDRRSATHRPLLPGEEPLVERLECLACHLAPQRWSAEEWARTVVGDDPEWAPSVASGIAHFDGDSFRYDRSLFDSNAEIFFDLTRKPDDASCLACHTTRDVGPSTPPRWLHDRDVHLQAGMSCVDCHRNGIDHHTVRGYEGEKHPGGNDVSSLSCRGCHMGEEGGRFGSPAPLHVGLPPLHLEKIACTTCHAGPLTGLDAAFQQTSRAHRLGSASQERDDGDPPMIRAPVLLPGDDGLLAPHRVLWPSFWAKVELEHPRPIPLKDLTVPLRRSLRIRRDLSAEIEREQFLEKLPSTLDSIFPTDEKKAPGLVFHGKLVARNNRGGTSEWITWESAPYHWPLAHPVRPARQSLGSGGCNDCHGSDAAFAHQRMEPHGPFPAAKTRTLSTTSLDDLYDIDPSIRAHLLGKADDSGDSGATINEILERWQPLMEGRDLFKIYALLCTVVGTFLTLRGLLLRNSPRRREGDR